jgi:hypothetical protein
MYTLAEKQSIHIDPPVITKGLAEKIGTLYKGILNSCINRFYFVARSRQIGV